MSVGSWNTTTNKCTVTATTKGGGKASRTVDASSIYTNGRDSVDSATGISLVSGSVSYNSNYNTYSFTVNMTLENGKSVTRQYSGFGVSEAINSVGFQSTGSWSRGSRTITLTNSKTTTISLPSTDQVTWNWTRTKLTDTEYITAKITIGGKEYSDTHTYSL